MRIACRALPSFAFLLLVACGAAPPAGAPGLAESVAPPGPPLLPVTSTSPTDPRRTLDDAARAGAVTETLHGLPIEDPYRALEEDTPATRAWIDAQSARTESTLAALAMPARQARLESLLAIGTISRVVTAGPRVFYLKREAGEEQPSLWVAEDRGRGDRALAAPAPRRVLDPTRLPGADPAARAALDWFYPSPKGRLVAFGLSTNGDERSTLHVLDVATGALLPERIARTKWCNLAWSNDERGFYYTRYPAPGEPDFDAAHEDTYFPRIFFHAIGADAAADPRIYGGARGTDFPSPSVSDDDRWLVVNDFRGWSASDVHLVDRRAPADASGAPVVRPVVTGRDALTSGRVHRGKLYLLTNLDAPRYRLVVADRPEDAADPARWRTLLPEGDAPVENYELVADRLVVQTIDDVRARVRVYDLDGREEPEVALPTRGSIDGLGADPSSARLAYAFSSYFVAPTLSTWDVRRRTATVLDRVASDVDARAFELTQERVPSADGTPIHVYLVHRRGLRRDGTNPVLLTGYGGFNVSLYPTFTRHALYFLERGGVFAVANLRGGAEFGEAWHRAGNLLNKKHVFEDFEAVIRWLATSGVSAPARIAITGGSNGGLLMGAMITRCPDAFRAAATYVGLYDMVRYERFPPAELWASEYGSAADAEQLRYLHSYSPYHQVRAGTPYPAVLVETADHDSRVHWAHSTKFAAALIAATSSERPVWFYRERAVGHGAGTRLSDLVRRYARMYAFVEHELGMDALAAP
jgi:prolyl oligopeptidase